MNNERERKHLQYKKRCENPAWLKKTREYVKRRTRETDAETRRYNAELRERIRAMSPDELDLAMRKRIKFSMSIGMDRDRAELEAVYTLKALGARF